MDSPQGPPSPLLPPAPQGMPGPVAPPAPIAAAPTGSAQIGAASDAIAAANLTANPSSAPISASTLGGMPTAPGCFHVDLRLDSIQFDYDSSCPSQISQDQLELMGQIRKTEAALKAIFFPQGMPADLHLRKPAGPRPSSAHYSSHRSATVSSVAKSHGVEAQDHQDEADDRTDRAEAKTPSQWRAQKSKVQFRSYFNALFILAQLGLDGPKAQPFLARSALTNLKDQILTLEGGRIKNGYMQKLGENAIAFGSVPLGLAILYESIKWATSPHSPVWIELPVTRTIMALDYAWVGAMIGTFLSFALRNTTLTFDQLISPEDDQMNPKIRLVYVGLLTFVFTNALIWKIITVTLGSVNTAQITRGPSLGLLVGVLCGISERTIGEKLQKTAASLGK